MHCGRRRRRRLPPHHGLHGAAGRVPLGDQNRRLHLRRGVGGRLSTA